MKRRPVAPPPKKNSPKQPPQKESWRSKPRGPRKVRALEYRGYMFLITAKDNGTSAIALMDPSTGHAEHKIDVPTDLTKPAYQELVKIALAEEALEQMKRPSSPPQRRSTDRQEIKKAPSARREPQYEGDVEENHFNED